MKKYKGKISISLLVLLVSIFTYFINNYNDNKSYALDNNAKFLTVHYLDVGQGDSEFIELPSGEVILIDASEKEYGSYVKNYIDNLNYKEIDYLIGTHPHSDHIGGLEYIVKNFDIKSVYMPKVASNTKTYLSLLEAIDAKNLKINNAKKGDILVSDDGLTVSVLSPSNDNYSNLNNYSIVLKVVYYDTCFLFMGDAEAEVENSLSALDVKCDVIKIGHHGSSTSSSNNFVKNVNAKYGVIEVGASNKYNHPNSNVVKRWESNNTTIYRTDLNGNIVIKSDGKNISVSKEKE